LVFICFQKDPREQFIPIQERLDEGDRINQWTTHIGSAVFFCPPGVDEAGGDRGKYWGAGLFDAA
jgi:iron-dependent peroxidase